MHAASRALPQAGQGQDYVEGCNNKAYICYKCHQPGHWARDCPGEPADGQVRTQADPLTPALCVTDPLGTSRWVYEADWLNGLLYGVQTLISRSCLYAMRLSIGYAQVHSVGHFPAQDGKPAEEDAGDALAHAGLPRAVPAPEALPEEAISEQALTAALQASFGFSSFRRLQLPVIQSVLRGRTTLAIMPTGAEPCSRLSCACALHRCNRQLTILLRRAVLPLMQRACNPAQKHGTSVA